MSVDEIICFLKENIKGLQIYDEGDGMYFGQKISIDMDFKIQLEFYDDGKFACMQCWIEGEYGQIGEDLEIHELINIEEVIHYFNDFPKAYNKVSSILDSVIPIAEEFNIDILKLLNEKL